MTDSSLCWESGLPRADVRSTWRTDHPTDVVLTLSRMRRGTADPTHQIIDARTLWKTTLTADGPATMLLTATDAHTVTCRAWGPGARAAVAAAPELCGARDDPTGFTPDHPLLEETHRRHPGLRIPRSGRIMEALVPAIIEQRVIGLQAMAAWRYLVRTHGSPAPGPVPEGMMVVPSATTWASIPSWVWHRAGVDPRRARAVVTCASRAGSLERLTATTVEDATRRLTSLPEVGPWTAAEVAQRALGDADALSVGDYHLAGMVGHALFGTPFDDQHMMAALQPWQPHRYRVVRLLETAGNYSKPRRGPRVPFVDNRGR